jgi:hypothetical protein
LVFVPILLVVDKGALLSMNDSTLKALDFLSTMLMAAYFINPEVRALFGFS